MPNIALIIQLIRYLKKLNHQSINFKILRILGQKQSHVTSEIKRHHPGGTLSCPPPLPPSFDISTTALSNASVSTVSPWPHRRHLQSPSNRTPPVSSEVNREKGRSTRKTEGSRIGEEESLINFSWERDVERVAQKKKKERCGEKKAKLLRVRHVSLRNVYFCP